MLLGIVIIMMVIIISESTGSESDICNCNSRRFIVAVFSKLMGLLLDMVIAVMIMGLIRRVVVIGQVWQQKLCW